MTKLARRARGDDQDGCEASDARERGIDTAPLDRAVLSRQSTNNCSNSTSEGRARRVDGDDQGTKTRAFDDGEDLAEDSVGGRYSRTRSDSLKSL